LADGCRRAQLSHVSAFAPLETRAFADRPHDRRALPEGDNGGPSASLLQL